EAGLGALRALGAEADRAVRTVLGPAEDRLEGDGRHREKQLADMGAAAGAADRLVDRLAPATRDAGADEGLAVGPGLDARGIRRGRHVHGDRAHDEVVGDPQPDRPVTDLRARLP